MDLFLESTLNPFRFTGYPYSQRAQILPICPYKFFDQSTSHYSETRFYDVSSEILWSVR